METIGQRIKNRRKGLGLTQGDLSDQNLSRGMISLIERDQTTPSIRTLEIIASKLGVTVSDLLGEAKKNEDTNIFNTKDVQRIISMCKALINAKKYDDAETSLNELLSLSQGNIPYKGTILKLLGSIYFDKNDYKKAINTLSDAQLLITPFDLEEHFEIYYQLSMCYRYLDNYYLAIESGLYASILLRSKNNDKYDTLLHLKILYNLAHCQCRVEQFKQGLVTIEEAIELMNNTDVYYSEGSFYMLKGLAKLYLRDFKDGIQATKRALKILNQSKEPEKVIGCLTNMGILLRVVEEYEESINVLKKSLALSLDLHKDWYIINNLFELTITNYTAEKYSAAEDYAQRGILKASSYTSLKAKLLFAMFLIKSSQNLYGEALTYINQSESLFIENGDMNFLAKCYSEKARILSEQNLINDANKLLRKSNDLLLSQHSIILI
ncbi:helix-turn-helix domain-containing protein [Aquibacillus sp. 3ASR75-11]|uniref:Helix-turn-helix domain-containing protein n=1 Tax=Terrihalobacillus insolitus TaxID=2950438 RepID=A0A9X4AN31_9BACI|nr:helix-turn-helix transcriptional regulator [Terrihalobacillus insolitus]MDC3412988.1 helix-turn-helix domain-containing protein [Terrihalobacillus insolitus]MDC3426067.1 helix-turn-helix domain-containing protein [Terrihalobacillus insolitus]